MHFRHLLYNFNRISPSQVTTDLIIPNIDPAENLCNYNSLFFVDDTSSKTILKQLLYIG